MTATDFAELGHVQVHDDVTTALCREFLALVDALPETSWSQVIRAEGETLDYPLFPRDPQIDRLHELAKQEAADGQFSYSFARVDDSEENNRLPAWTALKRLLTAPQLTDLIAAHTGEKVTTVEVVYANCFRQGDFLTTHCDKGGGCTIAAAFSLTESWDPADGGCTHVLSKDRERIVDTANPDLGCLLLLGLRDTEVPHYVSEVTGQHTDSRFVRKSVIVRYS